jgi:hypothetical protein
MGRLKTVIVGSNPRGLVTLVRDESIMESWRLIDLDYSELLVAQTFY